MLPHILWDIGHQGQSLQRRPEVKTSSTNNNQRAPRLPRVRQQFFKLRQPVHHTVRLVTGHMAKQVMRCLRFFFHAWARAQNVQIRIDLHGICINNPRIQLFCQLNGKSCLAAGRWSGYQHRNRPFSSAIHLHSPRAAYVVCCHAHFQSSQTRCH